VTHANPDTHALNAALDFLSAVATGSTWQQALQQVVDSLADEPAARGVLPSALLDCRIATIRKLGGLPKELVGAFDSAIAQLVVGDSACDAEELTSLLKSMANAPLHIPRGTLDAALDRITCRITCRIDRGEDAHGLLGALGEIHDRVIKSEKQPEMRITSSGALHITLPTPELEFVPVEAPRPNEKVAARRRKSAGYDGGRTRP
jgi:hypothetical protein